MDDLHSSEPRKFDLADLGVLATGYDRDFDYAVTVAARAARAPIATFATADFVSRMVRVRAWTGLGSDGPGVTEVPFDVSFISRATSPGQLISVSDTAKEPRVVAHPFIRSRGIRSLLAAPVLGPAEEVVALLAVHDTLPRIWNVEERDALAGVAHFCTKVILLRAALRTLHLLSRDSGRENSAS